MSKRTLLFTSFLTLALVVLVGVGNAFADEVTFENITGPSTFGGAPISPSYSFGDGVTATFSGGTVLTNATNAPADETSIYGTDSGGTYSQTITVTFNQAITNFILNLYNGQVFPDTFVVSDNVGDSVTQTLVSNINSGNSIVEFAAAGTQVTITTSDPNWDFFIDDVQFNVPLIPTPESSTVGMLAAGLLTLLFLGWRNWKADDKVSNRPVA